VSDNLILFLPGWSGLPKASYNPLLRSFARWGFDTLSLEYDLGGTGSIGRTAHICEKELKKQQGRYQHITVVGHSMGGLVGRMFNCDLYDSYVSIATPHEGTWRAWAGVWLSRSAREMLPNSPFLASCPVSSKPSLAISAAFDVTVSNAKLAGARNVTIPFTTHVTVLWNLGTAMVIRDWIPSETGHEGVQRNVSVG
jgi:hypothetical protein